MLEGVRDVRREPWYLTRGNQGFGDENGGLGQAAGEQIPVRFVSIGSARVCWVPPGATET